MNNFTKRETNPFSLLLKAATFVRLSRVGINYYVSMLLLCGAVHAAAQNYFRTDMGVLYVPVLPASPTPTSAGAVFVSSSDKKLYWYDGTQWQTSACCLPSTAPDGTTVVTLTSPTGRVWMDRNLGATQAATSSTDYMAYGSLFQWIRKADGHEKITWTSSTAGAPVNGTTTTLSASTTAPNSLFILNANTPYDWLGTQQANGNFWWNGSASGANNPCPTGFHVPTYVEWNTEYSAGITNAATAYSRLKLPMAGHRNGNSGGLSNVGSYGYYWSSTVSGVYAYLLNFNNSSAGMNSLNRANGFSVRCIQDAPVAPDGTTQVVDLISSTGRVWMDRNLGASQAATSSTDYLAYGSLYQWCRATDGHEQITWTSSTAGTPVNGTTTTLSASTTAPNSLFILNANSPYDWLSTQQINGNLWWSGAAAGANNPCPTGYHVPTQAEWQAEITAGINNSSTAYSQLKLPKAGFRDFSNGSLTYTGSDGYYWSSSVNNLYGYYLHFNNGGALMYSYSRADGINVRCVKN